MGLCVTAYCHSDDIMVYNRNPEKERHGRISMKYIILLIMILLASFTVADLTHSDIKVNEDVHWVKNMTVTYLDNAIEVPAIASNVQYNINKVSIQTNIKTKPGQKLPAVPITDISANIKIGDNIIVEYDTPAPVTEEQVTDNGKTIRVYDDNEVGYTNVVAETDINVQPRFVRLYQVDGAVKTLIPFTAIDNKIQWIVPHLSEQNYEIIYVSNADVYDGETMLRSISTEVKYLDDEWSSAVYDNQYVRVTFETQLNKNRDIRVYANGIGNIQIYTLDNIYIASLYINGKQLYHTGLDNLVSPTDTFDFRVTGTIIFDYIADPADITYDPNAFANPSLFFDGNDTTSADLTATGIVDQTTNLTVYLGKNYTVARNVSLIKVIVNESTISCGSGSPPLSWSLTQDDGNLWNSSDIITTSLGGGLYSLSAMNIYGLRVKMYAHASTPIFDHGTCNVNFTGFTFDTAPRVTNISVIKSSVPGGNKLDCTFQPNDGETSPVSVWVTWYQNISGVTSQNTSFDYNYTTPTLDTQITTDIGTGSWTGEIGTGKYWCALTINQTNVNMPQYYNSTKLNVNTYTNFTLYGTNAWNKTAISNLQVYINHQFSKYYLNLLSWSQNPIAAYNFLAYQTSQDYTGNNHGFVGTQITYNDSGANFNDGISYLNNNDSLLSSSSGFTLAITFKSTNTTGNHQFFRAYKLGGWSIVGVSVDTNTLTAEVITGVTGTCSKNIAISANTWYNSVVTYNSTLQEFAVWLDGVKMGNISCTGDVNMSTENYIGLYHPTTTQYAFYGSIKNMMIFNRTLNSAELLELNNTKNPILKSDGNLTFAYDCLPSTSLTYSASGYMNTNSYNGISNCNQTTNQKNQSFWQAIATVNVRNVGNLQTFSQATIKINDSIISNTSTFLPGVNTYYLNNGTYDINGSSAFALSSQNLTELFGYGSTNTINLNLTPKLRINMYREFDGMPFNNSENSSLNYTIQMSVYCSNVSYNSDVTSNIFTLTTINCQYNYFRIRLETSSGQSYYRTGYADPNIENYSIYMIDPKVDTAVQYIYQLNDLTNKWHGGYAKVYTFVNGTRTEVIRQYWTIDGAVTLWLNKYSEYDLCMVNTNGVETCPGTVIAETATTQTVVQPGLPIGWNVSYSDNRYNIYPEKNLSLATLYYKNIVGAMFNLLNWTIYEDNITTGNVVYSNQTTNGYNVTWIATGLNKSNNYIYVLIETTPQFGTITYIQPLWFASHTEFPGFESWTADIKLWIAIGMPVMIILIATATSVIWLSALALIFMGVFAGMGWYEALNLTTTLGGIKFDVIIIIIIIFAGLLGLMYWYERGK